MVCIICAEVPQGLKTNAYNVIYTYYIFYHKTTSCLSSLVMILYIKTMVDTFKEKIARFFGVQDRVATALVWASFLVCLANIVLVVVFIIPRWGDLGFLRLHYTVALGVDWVDDWRYIFVFPALAVVIFVLNGWMAGRLSVLHRRLGTMLLGLTMIIEIFIAVGGAIAISLNG